MLLLLMMKIMDYNIFNVIHVISWIIIQLSILSSVISTGSVQPFLGDISVSLAVGHWSWPRWRSLRAARGALWCPPGRGGHFRGRISLHSAPRQGKHQGSTKSWLIWYISQVKYMWACMIYIYISVCVIYIYIWNASAMVTWVNSESGSLAPVVVGELGPHVYLVGARNWNGQATLGSGVVRPMVR